MIGKDIRVETWDEFDSKARELVASGFTEVTPKDNAAALLIGYTFKKPQQLDGNAYVYIRAAHLKRSIPDMSKSGMSSETGRIAIAKGWGNYVAPVQDPDAVQLSPEETEKYLKELSNGNNA